ncbi:sensor histidine kinase [Polaribacter dokdonensis]|uniref:histidine kinase n=1 Tax=Polaribacter dokdonensis DSW-5 TaxID=1300348 RepID=A0A0M9CFM4_9FLAO|nr:ATP-binding protein [Polaribacter dokdonensis]KOY51503.1 Two-component system sensor histidine kinase [Polaribacter dokdonensis DSW-5]SEE09996.1 HAMP domain-containing protein [Polaribacter dokdonensis DSW-5]
MIILVLLASILILVVTVIQYDEQTKDYNIQRFERKEATTIETINLELTNKTSYPVNTKNLAMIFQERVYEISSINKLNVSIFDLHGNLLVSSKTNAFEENKTKPLSYETLNDLSQNSNHRIFKSREVEGDGYQSSYTYINDPKFKRIGILELQFTQDNSEIEYELEEFIKRLSLVYILMFLIAIALAYFLSSYITRSINSISDRMQQTRLNERNEKIMLGSASSEIEVLVDAYNSMIDQLEESAAKLAKSEREQAWREMAKQVAHEIKNPLTPMRLTVQSFERKFNPDDENIKEKLAEYSQTLIQQIDVMSSIASAFSDFAKMPSQKRERINVVSVVKLALDIFNEDYISYLPSEDEIYANLDKTQLIRIVNNLVKNATQAADKEENPLIEVKVISDAKNVTILVSDNGKGIADDVKDLIFEPKFTTKTSGMGLGLGMIKNIIEAYDGSISFTSRVGEGTVFTVILPKE